VSERDPSVDRRDYCVDTGEPCQCIRGGIGEAHCLDAKRRRPFEEFLASHGLTMREWQERYRARDPEAYRIQLLWQNSLDAEAKERGELPEFNETALAELGISLSEWHAMAPLDRLRTMSNWFDSAPEKERGE
jgi:hypothetical protein